MIVELGEKKLKFPEGWDELTFGQFIDILVVQKDNYSTIDSMIKIFDILSRDNNEETWKLLTMEEIQPLLDELDWVNEHPEYKNKKSKTITYKGKKYRMKEEFAKLTAGEMISLELMLQNKQLDLLDFEIAFGILFRELDEDGKPKEFDADAFQFIVQELRDEILMNDVMGILMGFTNGEGNSTTKGSKASSPVLKIVKTSSQSKTKKKK